MNLGQKLKKLRTEKGLTQKDLADQLHVTFQTVSKWESDTNEPDFSTIKELAKIFDCSIEYLFNDEENKEKVEVVEDKPSPIIEKETIIIKEPMHICARCGKGIEEEDLTHVDNFVSKRSGRNHRREKIGEIYYHKDCLEELKKEEAIQKKNEAIAKAKKSKKLCFGWGIFGGVVGLVVTLLCLLLIPQCKAIFHPAIAVLLSIVASYGLFSAIYCILSGSYIGDVFIWCAQLSIKFPGLIFSWDLDGIAWLIAMKILFMIIGFVIGILALMLAIGLSMALGMISFPFVLIHNVRTLYEDAI